MHPPPLPSIPHRTKESQRGAALMVMLVVVVLGFATVLVSSLSSSAQKSARQQKTAAALAQAKDALIGYAITYGDTHSGQVHGYLPCPDRAGGTSEGIPDPAFCGNKDVSAIGRLPWRSCSTCEASLDLPTLRDGEGECLWYAVSGTYKNNPKTDLMNWDNNGLFEILDANGVTVAQNVVAVVFAPGIALGNQNRAPDGTAPICGGNYTAANYLDSDGAISNATVSGMTKATSQFRLDSSSQINDKMIFITRDDIWNTLARRNDFLATLNNMTKMVAECIAYFGTKNSGTNNTINTNNKSLPWPSQLSITDYGDIYSYNDKVNLFAGRIPYQVDTSRSTTTNKITSDYLLSGSGSNCLSGDWAAIYPWWDNWKDHLFYGLSAAYKPATGDTNPCSGSTCISVNTPKYAAVVMFSGNKLSALNQSRTNKSVVADYLEGVNASNVSAANPPAAGNETYQASAVSSTFNDILYCIKEDLSVIPCP